MPNFQQSDGSKPSLPVISVESTYRPLYFILDLVKEAQSCIKKAIPEAEIIILDSTQDQFKQISQAMKTRSNITSIHIVDQSWETDYCLSN